ncbi:MAG: LysM peptidoglycan-binding domain-containing protein, partial [Pseudomonas sp.]
SSAGEAGAAVVIQWFDAAGNLMWADQGNMVDSASGGAVYESRLTKQVPWGAVFMSIGATAYRSGGGDPLFIDNFTWGAMPDGGDLSWNGAFEWDDAGAWSYSSEYGGSAQFNLTGEARFVSYERISVRPGTSVNARGNVQQGASSEGEAWGAVFLRFYDAEGNDIHDEVGDKVDSGSGGAWHSSVVRTRVPPGAVSMAVGGVAARTGGNDPLWMDDFSWNFEREGEFDVTGSYGETEPGDDYNMPGKKEYWYEYDANNRVIVANGKLKNGEIVLGGADISYALDYDEAGRAVRRRYLAGLTEVSETTQYDERGQRLRVFQSVPLGGGESLALKESYTYDAVGRVTDKREYFANGTSRNGVDTSGWLKHAETYTYDADGRILTQQIQGRALGWTATAQGDGGAWQTTNLAALQNLAAVNYQDYGYDVAGRLRGYSYRYSLHEEGGGAQAADPKGYTHRYIYAYEARDSYLESRIYGSSSNSNFRASTSYSSYDAWGRRVAVREQTPLSNDLGKMDDRIRYFSYDATGNILQRREGSLKNGLFDQSAMQATQNQLYAYVGGQLVASGKRNGEVDVVGRLTAYQSNNAGGSSRTTVLAGESLRSIAQRVYGNANLWYVLAEANAINDDSGLTAGTTLVVPEVKVTANDATTFKPFSPQEAIGNTSPSLPYIEPPPKEHSNGIAMVLMVIVAVVATVFTAGAAALALGVVASSTGIFAAGAAVLGGAALAGATTFAATAAVAGAAFAGGMAGSIASQAVGKAMGVVDSFSLRNAVASGIGSVVGAGVGAYISKGATLGELLSKNSYGTIASMGATNAAGAYAGGRIAGVQDTHFSWREIASSAVSSIAGAKLSEVIGAPFGATEAGKIANRTLVGMAGGVVSLHTRRSFGMGDDVNYGPIAADAFGNALAGSIVEGDFADSGAEERVLGGLRSQVGTDTAEAGRSLPLASEGGSMLGHAKATSSGATQDVYLDLARDPTAKDLPAVQVRPDASVNRDFMSLWGWALQYGKPAPAFSGRGYLNAYRNTMTDFARYERAVWTISQNEFYDGQDAVQAQRAAYRAARYVPSSAEINAMRGDMKFLGAAAAVAGAGIMGGVAAVSPIVGAGMTGMGLVQGAKDIADGNYVRGGITIGLSVLGAGVVARDLKAAQTWREAAYMPLGPKGIAGRSSAYVPGAPGSSFDGLGDATTSPALADPRIWLRDHIETFRDGGSFLTPKSAWIKYNEGKPLIGETDQFITTRAKMDEVLREANGDLSIVKEKLGIPQNAWNDEIIRVDVHNPLLHNARLPTGLERGANEKFIWGGYTSGGQPEAVIDQVPSVILVNNIEKAGFTATPTGLR